MVFIVMELKADRKESLVDVACRELAERFVTLKLQPGSVWSEVELSALIGIGRTPVREAVLKMASDQLVTVIRRAGILISKISIEEQLFVLETRRVLEQLVSLRAAKRATDEERAKLTELATSIETAGTSGDVLAYMKYHFKIKPFVAQCARNPYAARALFPLHTLSQRFYFAYHREFDNLPEVSRAHAHLTRAIVSGDESSIATFSTEVADIAENFTRDLFHRNR
jgi:DNA-binding GntR family transcriptional regulator